MAEILANSINVDLQIPRIAARQQGRNNVPTDSIDDYFRRAVWYPNLDTIISAIEYRFKTHSIIVNKMVAFIPGQMSYFEWADVKDCVQIYKSVLGNPDEEVKLQYLQWKEFCSALEESPMTPLETLEIIPKRLGHIKNLLTIFCTVPVTTCSVERTFSALRIL